MATWPTSQIGNPNYGMVETVVRPQVTHEFEANYGASRPMYTRKRRRFSLSYGLMPNSAYDYLDTFVGSNYGTAVDFYHPVTNSVFSCRFGSDLESTIVSYGFRSAKMVLEEE